MIHHHHLLLLLLLLFLSFVLTKPNFHGPNHISSSPLHSHSVPQHHDHTSPRILRKYVSTHLVVSVAFFITKHIIPSTICDPSMELAHIDCTWLWLLLLLLLSSLQWCLQSARNFRTTFISFVFGLWKVEGVGTLLFAYPYTTKFCINSHNFETSVHPLFHLSDFL